MAEPSEAEAQHELIYKEQEMPQYVMQAPKEQMLQHTICGGLNQQTDFTKAQTNADYFKSQVESESGLKFDKWEVTNHSTRSTNPPFHGLNVQT
jgi:hypothetical protein